MSYSLREVARHIGARVEPEAAAAVEVSSVTSIANAMSGDLVFVDDARLMDPALASRATAIIAAAAPPNAQKPVLIAAEPKLAFVRAAELLMPVERRSLGVHPTAVVDGTAKLALGASAGAHAVIGAQVEIGARTQIGPGVKIGERVRIGADCVLHANVSVYPKTRMGDRVIVHAGAVLGADGFGYVREPESGKYRKFPQIGTLEIGDDVEIGANTTIDRGALGVTVIASGVKLDNLVHVGHNVELGENVVIAAQTGISGSSKVAAGVLIGGQVGIADHVEIGPGVVLGAQSGVPTGKVVRDKGLLWGTPARPIKQHLRELAALARLARGK